MPGKLQRVIQLQFDAAAERRCWDCGVIKPIKAFAYRSMADGTRSWRCRSCHATARRAHYLAHRERYIAREAARVVRKVEANRLRLAEYLIDHPCIDCGETDPIVLDFDHRDPTTKVAYISRMLSRSWSTIRAEIAKCDVRCANCHMRRTAEQFGWRKARLIEAT